MKLTLKKIIIWTSIIIGLGIFGYIGFVGYVIVSITNGCGMDDGPFEAVIVDDILITDSIQVFNLDNGELILYNRNDSLSPILTLIENEHVIWNLDMDVSQTNGYETCMLWKISNLTITNGNPIRLSFTGHWTYGAEAGSMKINRKTGKNSFCLSW
jgi:hypothetical protein